MGGAGRRAVLVLVAATNILVAGAVGGWNAIEALLRNEGHFAELCEEAPPCAAQNARYTWLFVVTRLALYAGGVLAGILYDRVGPRTTVLCAYPLLVLGSLLFGLAGVGSAGLLFPALSLLAVGSCTIWVSVLSFTKLFPWLSKSIRSIFSALWISGSVVSLTFQLLVGYGIASRTFVFLSYAALSVGLFVVAAMAFPNHSFAYGERPRLMQRCVAHVPEAAETYESSVLATAPQAPAVPALYDASVPRTLCSGLFVGLVVCSTVFLSGNSFLLGSLNAQLLVKGDLEGHWILVANVMSSLVPPLAPLFTLFLERFQCALLLGVVCVAGTIAHAFAAFPQLPVQLGVFFLLPLLRVWGGAVPNSLIEIHLGTRHFGSYVSILLLAGVPAVGTVPLFMWLAQSVFRGSFLFANLSFAVTHAALLTYVVRLARLERTQIANHRIGLVARQAAIVLNTSPSPTLESPTAQAEETHAHEHAAAEPPYATTTDTALLSLNEESVPSV